MRTAAVALTAALALASASLNGQILQRQTDFDRMLQQQVDALRARKPMLAETTVYDNPPGGHTFDRRVDPKTSQPENTREQRDSWNRVWTFLDWHLDPFHADTHSSTK